MDRAALPTREADFYEPLISACHLLGWRAVHFRSVKRFNGTYATPVQGDAEGWVDFILVHPAAARIWYVELKSRRGQIRPEQRAWGEALITAGAIYKLVRVPDDWDEFLRSLRDAVRPL